jgi:restriction system protein
MARKKLNSNIPTFDELLIPTIQAIQQLGGSGTNEGINESSGKGSRI